jgi:PadR family transcriptional regulator, regulatory protein PadR
LTLAKQFAGELQRRPFRTQSRDRISACKFAIHALCRRSTMSTDQPRLSSQTLRVLGALMSCQQDELSGAQIGRTTKLPTGTLYPILSRLERAHWLESRWEDGDPHILGRPRRRYYRITPLGAKNATIAVRQVQAAFGQFAWT